MFGKALSGFRAMCVREGWEVAGNGCQRDHTAEEAAAPDKGLCWVSDVTRFSPAPQLSRLHSHLSPRMTGPQETRDLEVGTRLEKLLPCPWGLGYQGCSSRVSVGSMGEKADSVCQ